MAEIIPQWYNIGRMKKAILSLLSALALSAGAVELIVQPGNGMTLVEGRVDGTPCTLLVDTGASHTTLDLNFVTNRLAGAALREVELVGRTNVASAPKFVETKTLTIGEMTFETEGLMALDLSHLSGAVGRRVDGILGMNHLRSTPCILSLKSNTLTWNPPREEYARFVPLNVRDRGTTFEVWVTTPTDARVALLVDTGSTFSFVDETLWPAAEEEVKMSAADVNRRAEVAFRRGKSSEIVCGEGLKLTLSPILTPEKGRNQLGYDVFRDHDLLITPRRLGLSFQIPNIP